MFWDVYILVNLRTVFFFFRRNIRGNFNKSHHLPTLNWTELSWIVTLLSSKCDLTINVIAIQEKQTLKRSEFLFLFWLWNVLLEHKILCWTTVIISIETQWMFFGFTKHKLFFTVQIQTTFHQDLFWFLQNFYPRFFPNSNRNPVHSFRMVCRNVFFISSRKRRPW